MEDFELSYIFDKAWIAHLVAHLRGSRMDRIKKFDEIILNESQQIQFLKKYISNSYELMSYEL